MHNNFSDDLWYQIPNENKILWKYIGFVCLTTIKIHSSENGVQNIYAINYICTTQKRTSPFMYRCMHSVYIYIYTLRYGIIYTNVYTLHTIYIK